MDGERFEAMTRFLAAPGTRRGVARGGLAALGLWALGWPAADEAETAQQRSRRTRQASNEGRVAAGGPECTVCLDEDECPFTSVQAAIAAANAGDLIIICKGTYKETVTVTKNLTIVGARGNDPDDIVLDGSGRASVVTVQPGIFARLGRLRVTDGRGTGGRGGGILNFGELEVVDCHIDDNKATSGGGIYNAAGAKLTLNVSIVEKNDIAGISPQTLGGGIYNAAGGIISVSGSRIRANEATIAGGILNSGDLAISDRTLVVGNTADFGGAGIHSSGILTLNDSQVVENGAGGNGGGILINNGSVALTDSKVVNNTARRGGGVYIQVPDGGLVVLRRSNVVRNVAKETGGGIFASPGGRVTLDVQSKVAGNEPNNCVGTDACRA